MTQEELSELMIDLLTLRKFADRLLSKVKKMQSASPARSLKKKTQEEIISDIKVRAITRKYKYRSQKS